MSNIQVTQGTQTAIRSTAISANEYQHVIVNQGTTADSPFTGTFLGGTINTGTVDSVSQFPPNYFGTTVSTGTTTLGTIKPAVAGSAIFVTDLIISVGTLASNVVLGMGGTSTPLIGTLSFAANGGMVSNFRTPGSVTSGSALVYQQSAGIPLSITVNGFVR
jgi:hypothetical protein